MCRCRCHRNTLGNYKNDEKEKKTKRKIKKNCMRSSNVGGNGNCTIDIQSVPDSSRSEFSTQCRNPHRHRRRCRLYFIVNRETNGTKNSFSIELKWKSTCYNQRILMCSNFNFDLCSLLHNFVLIHYGFNFGWAITETKFVHKQSDNIDSNLFSIWIRKKTKIGIFAEISHTHTQFALAQLTMKR